MLAVRRLWQRFPHQRGYPAAMPDKVLHRWWMPPSPWRKREHLSPHYMDEETAKKAGALRPEPSTRRVFTDPGETGRMRPGSAPQK